MSVKALDLNLRSAKRNVREWIEALPVIRARFTIAAASYGFLGRLERAIVRRLPKAVSNRKVATAVTLTVSAMSADAGLRVGPPKFNLDPVVAEATSEHSRRPSSRRNNGLPIVFVHRGNADYLQYALAQAKLTNPDSPIYLIGDRANDVYPFIEHHMFDEHYKTAREFEKLYKHYSTSAFAYERFNFVRWFVLNEFAAARGLTKFLYLDSDILVFADVTKDQDKFDAYEFSISHGFCGAISFWNTRESLDRFCRFMMDVYSKRDRYDFDKAVAHYATRRANHLDGGVCDMTMFSLYVESHFGDVGEVSLPNGNAVYDPNIGIPDPGFIMENGIKKLSMKADGPYGIHARTGREMKLQCLHFQGTAKAHMKRIFHEHLEARRHSNQEARAPESATS